MEWIIENWVLVLVVGGMTQAAGGSVTAGTAPPAFDEDAAMDCSSPKCEIWGI